MPQKWKKMGGGPTPDGKQRLSQVITGYGPGALVDLLDHAVLVGGLDFWHYDKNREQPWLSDPRLRDAIAAHLRRVERDVAPENAFKVPPPGDDKAPTRFAGIDVLEFPQWFACQNTECRALMKSSQLELAAGKYVHACTRAKRTECVPVRFVAACKNGHIDDFPWVWFAHRDVQRCAAPSLQLQEGATGDFSEVRVSCACGASAPLSAAQVAESNPPCNGRRPWLGPDADEPDCGERQRLLVRTASNSYFAQVVSGLSIPDPGRELENVVKLHWGNLKNVSAQLLPAAKMLHDDLRAALRPYDDAEVLSIVAALREDRPAPREALRTAELKQFLGQQIEIPGELPSSDWSTSDGSFWARRAIPDGGLPGGVEALVLAHRLREIRVQVGFTRIEPVTANLQGEYDTDVRSAPLAQVSNWLPATEIRGEGILVVLDGQQVLAWENRPAVVAREKALRIGYDAWALTTKSAPPFPGARFYLLHSFAHLLVSAIALECGYSASALRERIYCAPAKDPTPMAAVMISTGTPGSEGTLGGLIEQGRRLRAHLRRAYELGVLCSNDPVCGTHSPSGDLGERHLEGAACHGCLFVAECSCERFNRYLDRALVVPTIGQDQATAFFRERP